MTTPTGGGGAAQPRVAGFSSPVGTGNMAKRVSAAAAADIAGMAASAKSYADSLARGRKEAQATTAEVKKQASLLKTLADGRVDLNAADRARGANGRFVSRNGGGASIPPPPGQVAAIAQERGAPAGMPRAVDNGQPVLGGGARMPKLPGAVGAGAASIPGLEGNDAAAAVVPNGGSANFPVMPGWIGGMAKTAGAAGAAAAGSAMLDVGNYREADWVANRMARISTTGYDKTLGGNRINENFGGAFRSPAEMQAMALPVINQGGFAAGTAGFSTVAGNAAMAARLNPLMGGAQAGQVAVNMQNPQLFSNARMMLGVETIGRGGEAKGIDQIAQDIVRSMGGGNRPLTQRELAAEMGPNGNLRFQMQQLGMDANMQQSIQDYLGESATAGRYVRPSEIKAGETSSGDSVLNAEQRGAEARMNLITSHLEEWSTGFQTGVDKMADAIDIFAAAIRGMPDFARMGVFGGAGMASGVGAGVGGGAGSALTGLIGGIGGGLAARGAGGLLRRGGAAVSRSFGRGGSSTRGSLGQVARSGGRALVRGGPVGIAGGLAGGVVNDDRGGAREHVGTAMGWGAAGAGIGAAIGTPFFGIGAVPGAAIGGALGGAAGFAKSFFGDGYGEKGDGYGRKEQTRMPGAGWGGVSQPEMGDGEGGGRGPQTISFLKNLLKGAPPHRITSELRPGARTTSGNSSYHSTGHALDIAGPTPGRDTNEMLAINRYLANKLGQGAQELIYSGPGAINLHGGKPHQYKGKVRALHHDHVHVAVTNASLKRIGKKVEGGSDEPTEGLFGSLRKAAKHVEKQIRDQNKRNSRFRGAQRNGFSEKKAIEDFFGRRGMLQTGALPASEPDPDPTEGKGEKKGANQGGAAGPSVGRSAIDKFLMGLRMHESGGDYTAENGGTRGSRGKNDTSASGAYQYIDGTWNNFRGYKYAAAAPPSVQDERARIDAGRLYDKYKDWRLVAAAHFQGEGFVKKNPDPNAWKPGSGSRNAGNPSVDAFVKDVLQRGGLPETGDGLGSGPSTAAQPAAPDATLADVRTPRAHSPQRGGGSVQVSNSRGGSIHIAKVEVNLQTPQVSNQEAQRIGKMVVEQIARELKMKEMSR